jgi:hypothetical protein
MSGTGLRRLGRVEQGLKAEPTIWQMTQPGSLSLDMEMIDRHAFLMGIGIGLCGLLAILTARYILLVAG